MRKVTTKVVNPSGNRLILTGDNSSSAISVGRVTCKTNDGDDGTKQHAQNTKPIKTVMLLTQYSPNSSLHEACIEGELNKVKYILSHGLEDIDCRGWKGRTPVMMAAWGRHVAVFDFLVEQGCDLSAVGDDKDTVLHVACQGGSTDIVKKLLHTGRFNKEVRNSRGWTPLMTAVVTGYLETVKLLLRKNCSLKALSNLGENLLHLACTGGSVDVVKFILLQKFVSIDSRDKTGNTPIMLAVLYSHKRVFDLLVCSGSSLKVYNAAKRNLLHLACIAGQADMMKYILSQGIFPIDCRDANRRTPLLLSSVKGWREIFVILLNEGCDTTAVDKHGNNILHFACMKGHEDIVKHILTLKTFEADCRGIIGRTPVMLAAEHGHIKIIDLLISAGCELRAVDDFKYNLLHIACVGGHIDVVKAIISKGIIHIDSKGFSGRTSAMAAVEVGNVEILRLLVNKGCDLAAVNYLGETALHRACFLGRVECVKYLLTLNVVERIKKKKNNLHQTPVEIAERQGYVEIVRLLQ